MNPEQKESIWQSRALLYRNPAKPLGEYILARRAYLLVRVGLGASVKSNRNCPP